MNELQAKRLHGKLMECSEYLKKVCQNAGDSQSGEILYVKGNGESEPLIWAFLFAYCPAEGGISPGV